MNPIALYGTDAAITDIYLGIADNLPEGNPNRYELSAMPQNKLSALGTKMFIDLSFGESFPVGEGLVLEFVYDTVPAKDKVGVDRSPQKTGESFTIAPPYWSQTIKKMGTHLLTIVIYRKYKFAGIITRIEKIGSSTVKYTIVPPEQGSD